MRRIAVLLAALDALCVALGLAIGWQVWLWSAPNLQRLIQVSYTDLLLPNPWIPSGLVCIVVWVAAMARQGLLDPGRMENSVRIVSAIWRSTLFVILFILVMNFVSAVRVYPRSLIVAFVGSTWALLSFSRLSIFRILLRLPAPPTALNAVVVGTGEDGAAMAERLERSARHVCRLRGFVRTRDEQSLVPQEQILGDLSELTALVNRYEVGLVVLATRTLAREEALRMAVQVDRMGLRVLQVPYSWGVVNPKMGFARVGELELIDLVGVQYPTLAAQLKRAFDLAAVLVGGTLLLPFLLLVALAIRLQDGGPIFYLSKRVGMGGRTFTFYKFRSMVVGAENLRDGLPNEADGRLFKLQADPRVTRLGHFLRRSSIDELPQLLNVLRGDMNLVGPRPLPETDMVGIDQDPEMSFWFEQRHKVRPGITGLWQVSGRSQLRFPDMVRLDIHYIQSWNVWLDLQILIKTIPAVLRGRGAM
jgi:exopolysaccharide biosynthesis polyprenyl glycosylphosphotransferase